MEIVQRIKELGRDNCAWFSRAFGREFMHVIDITVVDTAKSRLFMQNHSYGLEFSMDGTGRAMVVDVEPSSVAAVAGEAPSRKLPSTLKRFDRGRSAPTKTLQQLFWFEPVTPKLTNLALQASLRDGCW